MSIFVQNTTFRQKYCTYSVWRNTEPTFLPVEKNEKYHVWAGPVGTSQFKNISPTCQE